MLPQLIPASFILARASVSLPEMRWAFDNGLVGAQTIVDFAAAKMAEGSDSPLFVDLAATAHEDLPGVKKILVGVGRASGIIGGTARLGDYSGQ